MKRTVGFVIVLLLAAGGLYLFSQPREPLPQPTHTIGLMGDVMLGRGVDEAMAIRGTRYIWGDVYGTLQSNTANIANLEATLTTSTDAADKTFTFKANPEHVSSLSEANITAVTLANNHALDFGPNGLMETIEILDHAGVHHVGAGSNVTEAMQPAIIKADGLTIGLIGITDNEPDWRATETTPGTNVIDIAYSRALEQQIRELKNDVDLVIVSAHWGPNYREHPPETFQAFARNLIAAGADVFHGHSAHIFQAVEAYKHGVILYDTGDFIDDYVVRELRNDLSFLFQLEIANTEFIGLRLLPTSIKQRQVNVATGDNKTFATDRMVERSKPFGTVFTKTTEGLYLSLD